MKQITTREEFNDWAADNYGTEENCEGTETETLMAGWVNATDVDSETNGKQTEAEFIYVAYYSFFNMGYTVDS